MARAAYIFCIFRKHYNVIDATDEVLTLCFMPSPISKTPIDRYEISAERDDAGIYWRFPLPNKENYQINGAIEISWRERMLKLMTLLEIVATRYDAK